MESALNTGDTAWMLTAAAMVLLMIPGLAFFMEAWFAQNRFSTRS